MKHFRLVRLLPWLVISFCPPLLGHCGGAVERGTETGNPPVVEQQKLHVVLLEDGVLIIGDAGAVPAGATVSVTNVSAGDRSEASAGADGSVSVSVPGTLADEYEVTVSSGGRSQTVRVLAAGDRATNTGGLAAASCDSLEQLLSAQVATEYGAASKACQVDSDCTTGGDVGCYYSCGGPIVSVAGLEAAQRSLLESTAPVCAELTSRCPGRGPPGCPFSFNTLACNGGTCGQMSCQGLRNKLGDQLRQILDNLPRDCTRDEDCTLVATNVRCLADCGMNYASVPVGRTAQLINAIQSAEATFCGEIDQRDPRTCPPAAPLPCPAEDPGLASAPRAACVASRCEIESVPVP